MNPIAKIYSLLGQITIYKGSTWLYLAVLVIPDYTQLYLALPWSDLVFFRSPQNGFEH